MSIRTLLLSLPLLCAAPGFAQQAAAPAPAARVYLDVVVTPHSGAPVSGLQQQDFTLLDNKIARPITSFTAAGGPSAPVQLLLVIDAVNAGFQTVAFERDQIDKFLRANGGELPFPTTLAVVTDTGTQIQNSSSHNGKELSDALDKYTVALRTIHRSAGFYGAEDRLQLSLRALSSLTAREQTLPGRKLILWVSPGWPLFSGPRVQMDSRQEQSIYQQIASFSTELRNARVTLYSIDPTGSAENTMRAQFYKQFLKGVAKPSQAELADLGLQVIATQSGGLALTSNNDMTAMLRQALDDASAYYELSFDPSPSDHADQYHQLEVQVAKPGLIARTRSGYYGQP
jgi:VWFA-related protein